MAHSHTLMVILEEEVEERQGNMGWWGWWH